MNKTRQFLSNVLLLIINLEVTAMALLYQKVEMKLNFSKEKTTVFKIAQQTIPPVTFKQLVSDVAESCGDC